MQNKKTKTSELLHTLDQIDMVDIYRAFHSTTQQYAFFSVAHGTFSKIVNILGYKTSLTIEENQNNILLHIRSQRDKTRFQQQKKPILLLKRKYLNPWRLNNTLMKN
jgi:hypothetical protein